MKFFGKFLFTSVVIMGIVGGCLQAGKIYTLTGELQMLGKQVAHYFISLDSRIKDLEKDICLPAVGEAMTEACTHSESSIDACDTSEPTKNVVATPPFVETTSPIEESTTSVCEKSTTSEAETIHRAEETSEIGSGYVIKKYGAVVGVFDTNDVLVEICSVYVMTLPEQDRAELSKGIYVNSWEEVLTVLARLA